MVIEPDEFWGVEDLDIKDIDDACGQSWFGSWEDDVVGADDMRFNVCSIEEEGGLGQAKKTAGHELGHALSLADNDETSPGQIMKQGKVRAGDSLVPGHDDIVHYHEKWGPSIDPQN